jgi:hypothetical protein
MVCLSKLDQITLSNQDDWELHFFYGWNRHTIFQGEVEIKTEYIWSLFY